MKIFTFILLFAIAIFLFINYEHKKPSGSNATEVEKIDTTNRDSTQVIQNLRTIAGPKNNGSKIPLANINIDSLVLFAKSLIGTPYVYASSNPAVGFDCSGFITYVFNHFGVSVPRSSIDFTDEGITIPLEKSKQGDLILFTGTDSTERFVGHMGIIVENNNDGISFIHSTSGKAHGVVITKLNDYYRGRFVKVVRIMQG